MQKIKSCSGYFTNFVEPTANNKQGSAQQSQKRGFDFQRWLKDAYFGI